MVPPGFPATVLVYVGLDAVGDGLMKLAFLRGLRAAFPAARITWAAGKGHSVYAGVLAPLVAGLADEVLDQAGFGSRLGELWGARPLAGRRFDLIIDTQRRLLTTLIVRRVAHGRLISAAAGFALSAARPPRSYRRPPAMAAQLADLLALAAGTALAAPAPLALDPATRAVAARLLPEGATYVGLAPGAGGRHKCWPLERYIAVAAAQVAAGRVPVVLLGPAEADWAAPILAAVPDALLPLQTPDIMVTPMLTIALGQRLAVAVANDSGTGHMLAAADTALISLFGPTPAEKFAPAAAALTVLRAQDFGGSEMERIPVEVVLTAIGSRLALCRPAN